MDILMFVGLAAVLLGCVGLFMWAYRDFGGSNCADRLSRSKWHDL